MILSIQSPSVVYSNAGLYSVSLIVESIDGLKDTLLRKKYIENLAIPVADFNIPNPSECEKSSITFSNNSINATSFLWDFADGSTTTIGNPVHSYTVSGDYTITMIATDSFACESSITKSVKINSSSTANFLANKTYSCDSNENFFLLL